MYAKCGDLREALAVFESIKDPNVFSWTILLGAHAEHQQFSEVVKLFQRMELEGVKPNFVTYSSLVGAIAEVGDFEEGWKAHQRIEQSVYREDVVLGTAMVNMYARCGDVEMAKYVFDSMPERDLVCWNAMISAYANHGHLEEAFDMFNNIAYAGMRANTVTYAMIFRACATVGDLVDARNAHYCFLMSRMQADVVLNTALLNMYAKCGSLEEAKCVFDRMQWKNTVSWNVMIAAYAQEGRYEEALEIYENMESGGVQADAVTFINVLETCLFFEHLLDGRRIHQKIIAKGFHRDLRVATSIISMYGRCGSLDEARRAFDDVCSTSNVVPWTAMVTAYAHRGVGKAGILLFHRMEMEGVKSNAVTFIATIDACSCVGALTEGHSMLNRILLLGYELDVMVGTTLINLYGKCGNFGLAWDVFGTMCDRNIVTWNTMISASAQQGLGNVSIFLIQDMVLDGIGPNEMTFLNVLMSCSHSGLWRVGLEYFTSMIWDHELVATREHYGCLIDLLGRSGQLEEAEAVITTSGYSFQLDWVPWMILLSSCSIHMDVERGLRAAATIFKLEPRNAAPYILLANMFINTGHLQALKNLRKLAMERRIKKGEASRSYIEVNGVVYEFGGGAGPHPMIERIGAQLQEWSNVMEKEGYVPLHDIRGYHDEKLAVAFGAISTPKGLPLRVVKNLRMCINCHSAIKFISRLTGRQISVRDGNRFHHFHNGTCSCGDYW